MSLETALRLKDGRTALLRRARSEDAETHIENWNTVGSERVYLMAEEFGQSVEEIRGQLRDADSRSALWLVAEVDRRLVGGAALPPWELVEEQSHGGGECRGPQEVPKPRHRGRTGAGRDRLVSERGHPQAQGRGVCHQRACPRAVPQTRLRRGGTTQG